MLPDRNNNKNSWPWFISEWGLFKAAILKLEWHWSPEGLVNHNSRPTPPQCLSHRSGWDWRICISNKFQVMLMVQIQEQPLIGTNLRSSQLQWQTLWADNSHKMTPFGNVVILFNKDVLLCPLEKQFMTYGRETILFVLYMLFYYSKSRGWNSFCKNVDWEKFF